MCNWPVWCLKHRQCSSSSDFIHRAVMEMLINNWFIWPFSAKISKEYCFKVFFFFLMWYSLIFSPYSNSLLGLWHLPRKSLSWQSDCSPTKEKGKLLVFSWLPKPPAHLPSPHVSSAHLFSLPFLFLCKLISEYLLFDNYMNRKRKESVPFEFRIIHSISRES